MYDRKLKTYILPLNLKGKAYKTTSPKQRYGFVFVFLIIQ